MFDIGLWFKRNFDIGRLDGMRVPAIDRTPSAGGFRNIEEPARIMMAKDHVFKCMGYVGGLNTTMGLALWNIVGLEFSLSDVATKHGGNRNHWSAALVNALDLLSAQMQRGIKT